MAPARSPWLTVVMAVTLVLFVVSGVRLFARYALLYRRPATLRLGPQGLELTSQTLLLGKVLRNRSLRIPMSGLGSLTREVRYSGAALYAGLLALAVGTYYGTGLLVDFRARARGRSARGRRTVDHPGPEPRLLADEPGAFGGVAVAACWWSRCADERCASGRWTCSERTPCWPRWRRRRAAP